MERDTYDGNTVAAVVALIEKATNSTRPELDPRTLKSIKSLVRHSDSELRLAVENLMSLMKRDHSQVRFFHNFILLLMILFWIRVLCFHVICQLSFLILKFFALIELIWN